MKEYGVIKEYDDYIGKIIDSNGNLYIFKKDDLLEPNTKVGDFVTFKKEVFKTPETCLFRAHFIKLIKRRLK